MTDVMHAPHVTALHSSPAESASRPVTTRARWTVFGAAAAASLVVTVGIPIITAAVIDGPAQHHGHRGLWVLGLAAIAFGVTESAMWFIRRRLAVHTTKGVEADIRQGLCARLQNLPWQFHLRCQSEKLVSGTANDRETFRGLLPLGAVFLALCGLQIAVVSVCLLVMYWPLGLVVLGTMAPIVATVLHDQGEFTRRKVPMAEQLWPVLEVIPNFVLVVLVVQGAYAVSHGLITIGTLAAFLTMTLSLVWPVTALGFLLPMTRDAMTNASGRRSSAE